MRENKRDSKNVPSNTKSFAEDEFRESLLKALAMYLRLFEEGKREREQPNKNNNFIMCPQEGRRKRIYKSKGK